MKSIFLKSSYTLLFFLSCNDIFSQSTGINTINPNLNAALDVQSASGKNQGLIIPRLKSNTKASFGFGAAEQGLIFYGTDTDSIYYWTGSKWLTLQLASTPAAGPWTKTGTTVALTTLSDNVGIGTTPSGTKLEVRGVDATPTNQAFRITNSAAATLMRVSNAGDIVFPRLVGKGVIMADALGALSVKKGNPVTGTGTAGKVAFWDTADSLNYTVNFHWDNTNTRLGIGTAAPTASLSVAEKFLVNGTTGGVTFSDPTGSIQFPAVSGTPNPMIYMFASGTLNADRMVISHSPGYPTYGLMYSDNLDVWHWTWNGTKAITFTSSGIGINNASPSYALDVVGKIKLQDGNQASGYVLASDANGVATWQDVANPKIAFKATASTDQPIATGEVDLVYNTVAFNDGGGFSANRFVAPSAGIYHFEAIALFRPLTPARRIGMFLSVNGTGVARHYNYGDTDYTSAAINATIKLAAGDVVTTSVYNNGAAASLYGLDYYNYFSGFKVY